MTITEFLLARIKADEIALWCGSKYHDSAASSSYPDCYMPEAECDSRDKREIKAKRRIVEREETDMRDQWRRRSDEHRQTWEQWLSSKGRGEMLTLRDLAAIYADHPDYDEAWRA